MPMQHFKNAQKMDISSLNIEGINAFLQDVASSNDPNSPISFGFFRMEAGSPLEYTYSYDECKIIVEGEMTVEEVGGETVNVSPGDVLFFPKGTKTIFSSKSSGLGFYCGQRKQGEL